MKSAVPNNSYNGARCWYLYPVFQFTGKNILFCPMDNEREEPWEGFEMLLEDGLVVHRPLQTR